MRAPFSALLSVSVLSACAPAADDGPNANPQLERLAPGTPVVQPAEAQPLGVGERVVYRATGLDDGQAYRATLVTGENVKWVDGEAVFRDDDGDGAADAGASTRTATIVSAGGMDFAGAKTVPGGDDDPSDPSGLFPTDGFLDIEVEGVGAGDAWLVLYENGGDSTFLELGADGVPVERYGVGGMVEVLPDGDPDVTPLADLALQAGDSTTYTIVDLDDDQAYRITLVVADHISWRGDRASFLDADRSGTADAGASEQVGVLTSVNGVGIDPAKTFPAGSDDPAMPSGIYPVSGMISVTVMGVGAGSIVPVAYENGGASTFLEVDDAGFAVEAHGLGGVLDVME